METKINYQKVFDESISYAYGFLKIVGNDVPLNFVFNARNVYEKIPRTKDKLDKNLVVLNTLEIECGMEATN